MTLSKLGVRGRGRERGRGTFTGEKGIYVAGSVESYN